MLLIRDVTRGDLKGLHKLAQVLDTVNLPADEKALEEQIDHSIRSFSGKVKDPMDREYLFVLEGPRGVLVGTSMIIARHGSRDTPHVSFEVSERETYSATIDRHFRHKVLSIVSNYDGPTEIGGLVVDPRFRGQNKPGKQLSFVRFLFIGMHRKAFREVVLAELLPPLLPDGRSLLWEALGRKFTDLSYNEADRLSRQNKEFIKELFPPTDVYATLFPPRVQKVIGQVGKETEGVRRMLEKIGFRYVERIDPFDGGPHFEARTEAVTLIRQLRRCKVSSRDLDDEMEQALVGVDRDDARNRFRAVRTPVRVDGEEIALPAWARDALRVSPGDRVSAVPFE